MIFDETAVLKLVKVNLTAAQKTKTEGLRLSMACALDDLSMRLRSASGIKSYTVSVSANSREVTLRGEADDLRYIFALKIGSGDYERILKYRDPELFLEKYEDEDATADYAKYYTQITASDGFPVIRFSEPLAAAETLTVYYYVDVTPDNMVFMRSISAVVAGTLAYFHGVDSERGIALYMQFKELAALARASDNFQPDRASPINLDRETRDIMAEQHSLRSARK